MYGLQAISAASGWTITILGISIVFSGLAILATFIANMERLLNLWDRSGQLFKSKKQVPHTLEKASVQELTEAEVLPSAEPEIDTVYLTSEQAEAAGHFRLLISRLGEPFSLPFLLHQAEDHGVFRPHSHLDVFLRKGLITECDGDRSGFYRWRKDVRVVPASSDTQ